MWSHWEELEVLKTGGKIQICINLLLVDFAFYLNYRENVIRHYYSVVSLHFTKLKSWKNWECQLKFILMNLQVNFVICLCRVSKDCSVSFLYYQTKTEILETSALTPQRVRASKPNFSWSKLNACNYTTSFCTFINRILKNLNVHK